MQELKESGVTGIQEEGPKLGPQLKGPYSLAKPIEPDLLTRGRFTGEGDVGEASRFASSMRNEQSGTLRLHIEPLNCRAAPCLPPELLQLLTT